QAQAGYPTLTPDIATSVTKTGGGRLIFDAANTYTGTTSIEQGVLAITGTAAIANSLLVGVAPGATFDVSGLGGGYAVPSGQTIAGSGTVLGSLTFGPGSTLSPGTIGGAFGAAMSSADGQFGTLQAFVVPEPTALGLVGVGLALLGLGTLRRKPAA
ncbi:MAG: autotransporter-associated beta strand repeat-containing protein, partial [Planctomycetaceae bacterium]